MKLFTKVLLVIYQKRENLQSHNLLHLLYIYSYYTIYTIITNII